MSSLNERLTMLEVKVAHLQAEIERLNRPAPTHGCPAPPCRRPKIEPELEPELGLFDDY